MTERICHLCGTHYNDDPHITGQPAHPPQKCLDILQFRYYEAESKSSEIGRQLARAKLEYTKGK